MVVGLLVHGAAIGAIVFTLQKMGAPEFLGAVLLLVGCSRDDGLSLGEKHLNVTIDHIKVSGPDEEAAIAVISEAGWRRREEIASITIPYLKSGDAEDTAGALAVLYRLRSYRPLHDMGSGPGVPTAWERKYNPGPFWTMLDHEVMSSTEYVHSLGNVTALRNLALYLSATPSADSKRELLRIATETAAKEQALICLAWFRDPQDMDSLLPFMLEDSESSRSLPYHFRDSYGAAAIPYLEQAAAHAKCEKTRSAAIKELKLLMESMDAHRPADD